MPTGQTIVNSALTILGILEQGGTPSTSDSNDSLAELNAMWDAWGIDEGLIYAVKAISKALGANTASVSIGNGATWNTPAPSRVYRAFIVTSGNRNEIKVVDAETYFSHNDLSASAGTPDEVYLDFNIDPTTGFATVYTWPVQNGTPTLELTVAAPFSVWALVTAYVLPEGYQDLIQYSLAYRLIPRFVGSVPQEIIAVVTSIAQKAEARIREMNAMNRKLPIPNTVNPEAQQAAASQQKA